MSDADTIRNYIKADYPPTPASQAANNAEDSLDALLAENQRLRKLLRDVLPHLEGGHDEARIWAQNVRDALRVEDA